MAVARLKCTECDNMILPQTAAANGGLCAQCAKIPAWIREEQREFERQLASGAVFTPTEQELTSAKQPNEFGRGDVRWSLEPEYYADAESGSVQDVIHRAATESNGYVFLVLNSGGRLNLSFTEKYGVCEYQNEDSDDFLYARTSENLREQVPAELHVGQACPCCGVGTLWYPSRFHMPRDKAFQIVTTIVSNNVPTEADWLDCGDISHTSRGRG